jgi:hypothetical protein
MHSIGQCRLSVYVSYAALRSSSDSVFHSAYIARMLGELLEDTDPCEAVEYVLPLLTGLALDDGKLSCFSPFESSC